MSSEGQDWSTSMWDCCHQDTLLHVLLCICLPGIGPPITYAMMLNKMGKDNCETALGFILMFCLGGFACCFAGPSRRELRQKYNLREEPCQDCCVHFMGFCSPCAFCQELREVTYRQDVAVAQPVK